MATESIFKYHDVNYIEFIILPSSKSVLEDGIFQTGISEQQFNTLLEKMTHKEYRYFEKQYKEYVSDDMYYETGSGDEIRVNKKSALGIEVNNNTITIIYNKTKLSILSFPSSFKINTICYIKKLVFRINNRIYINFEMKKYHNSNKTIYSIYVNYNHDPNVDRVATIKLINSVLAILQSVELLNGT